MSFQLPEPTTGYRLPNGEFVSTPEEYVARMTHVAANRMASAYVHFHPEKYRRAQATRAVNIVTEFLKWQAVETHKGTLNTVLESYDEFAKAAEASAVEAEAAAEAETVSA